MTSGHSQVPVPPAPAGQRAGPGEETRKRRVSHLPVTYPARQGVGIEALRDVSFDIFHRAGVGEMVVFLGPSGCGKSTLLKTIAGLIVPTAGEVLVHGEPVLRVGRDRGMVFQAYTSFGWLTIRRHVEYRLRPQGVAAEERRARADKYLQAVALAHFPD